MEPKRLCQSITGLDWASGVCCGSVPSAFLHEGHGECGCHTLAHKRHSGPELTARILREEPVHGQSLSWLTALSDPVKVESAESAYTWTWVRAGWMMVKQVTSESRWACRLTLEKRRAPGVLWKARHVEFKADHLLFLKPCYCFSPCSPFLAFPEVVGQKEKRPHYTKPIHLL